MVMSNLDSIRSDGDFDSAARDIARTLYPHQVEGVAFLLGRRRSLLADDMGLGKTRQSRAVEKLNMALRDLMSVSRKSSQEQVESPEAEKDRQKRQGKILGRLTRARLSLASVKVKQTLELVQGAVDQGEKVIVFSGYRNPIQRMAKHFGEQAVVVTGEVPAAQRQLRVDRFQNEESVRVFLANIHAGVRGPEK